MTSSRHLFVVAALVALAVSTAGCQAEVRNFGSQGAGGAGGDSTSSAGPGGICSTPSDCPAPADPCQIAVCVDGRCGAAQRPAGIEIEPDDRDCKRIYCDEAGTLRVDAADELPDDGNPCTDDACDGTTPTHTPREGEACPGGYCDEEGDCVLSEACVDEADCGISTDCVQYSCENGQCMEDFAPEWISCNGEQGMCDGEGECELDGEVLECVDDSDCDYLCGARKYCICLEGECYIVES